jgi:hypothetical protein
MERLRGEARSGQQLLAAAKQEWQSRAKVGVRCGALWLGGAC